MTDDPATLFFSAQLGRLSNCMLSVNAARFVARAVGISDADTHAGLKPEDKQRILLDLSLRDARGESSEPPSTTTVKDLEARLVPKMERGHTIVGFVGDGCSAHKSYQCIHSPVS